MNDWLEDHKNLSKFEKEFLSEFLNDIEKRENSSWAKPWDFVETQNAFTGHKYSGMNELFLELMSRARKYDDPRFATFNQARQNGYHIQKGSKGLPIQFFSFINKETKKPWNEAEFREKTKNMTPEEKQKEADKKIAIAKTFHVFNAKNLISNENQKTLSENIPITKFNKKVNTNELIDKFEKNLIENMEVGFNERHSEGAFYTPALDEVTMPLKEQFNSYEERMATLLHELGHATGHEKRLNRDLSGKFGTTNYSKEELIVEMNSVFMVNTLGLEISDEQKENHLLYLDSWGKHIKNNPKEFLYALNDSLKIKEYMLENGKFNEIFLEEEINLEDLKSFAKAYNTFSLKEYENVFTEEETLKTMQKQDYIMPIAYTEDFDSLNTIEYTKQVSYDLKNEEVINNLDSGFLSLETRQKISIQDISSDLLNADFDSFISDESMDIDRDQVTDMIKVAVYTESDKYIKDYATENNIEIKYLDLEDPIQNKNHILKDIDNDFFEQHNLYMPESFMYDKDFKQLVSYQLSHYESVEEVEIGDTYKILYNPDLTEDRKLEVYSNYKDLWEQNFKSDFIEDFNNFTLDDIESNEELNKVPNLLNKLSSNDKDIRNAVRSAKEYRNSIKEKDLDNDGIPDRIDIDDTRNSVQTTSDLYEVGNRTDKTHKDQQEKEQKHKPKSRTR